LKGLTTKTFLQWGHKKTALLYSLSSLEPSSSFPLRFLRDITLFLLNIRIQAIELSFWAKTAGKFEYLGHFE
jgi:hypothetical protein